MSTKATDDRIGAFLDEIEKSIPPDQTILVKALRAGVARSAVADADDVTGWQRGWRDCAMYLREAILGELERPGLSPSPPSGGGPSARRP